MYNSSLFDEKLFYQMFLDDLDKCQEEVYIESPFITAARMQTFDRVFRKLLDRGVKIYIMTRDPKEHGNRYDIQSEDAIKWCEKVGIHVLICVGSLHRKLAILDRKVLWEGSLNILSQARSREIMRRFNDKIEVERMFDFLAIGRFI